MHLAGIGWHLKHLSLVQIQPMLLPPASFFYLPPVQQANKQQCLFCFHSLFVLLEPLEVNFLLLLSHTQLIFVLSFNLPESVLCKKKFPLSLARFLGNLEDGRFGSMRTRLGFCSSFNGRLRSFSCFRKAINILKNFFQNFVVFHGHVAQPALQITFEFLRVCNFISERLQLFEFTNSFGHCFFTQFNQKFIACLPFYVIYSFY